MKKLEAPLPRRQSTPISQAFGLVTIRGLAQSWLTWSGPHTQQQARVTDGAHGERWPDWLQYTDVVLTTPHREDGVLRHCSRHLMEELESRMLQMENKKKF